MDARAELVVVKVGGSLYDLPDLGQRLAAWLRTLTAPKVLLVPGGGATTDVVRDLDRCHAHGEEVAHDLALRSLTLNAWFLAALLRRTAIGNVPVCNPFLSPLIDRVSLLDAHTFCESDAHDNPDVLPTCWEATSDSIAARAAVVLGASELVLLKSVTIVEPYDWMEGARRGVVDPIFSRFLLGALPRVRVVNLRTWC